MILPPLIAARKSRKPIAYRYETVSLLSHIVCVVSVIQITPSLLPVSLSYQPKVTMNTGAAIGVETLMLPAS